MSGMSGRTRRLAAMATALVGTAAVVGLYESPALRAQAAPPVRFQEHVIPQHRKPNFLAYYEAPDFKRQTLWEVPEGLQHGIQPTTGVSGGQAQTLLSAGFNGIFEHKMQGGENLGK